MLKGGAADVEGEVEAERGAFDEGDDLGDPFFKGAIAGGERGVGELFLEFAQERGRIVAEGNGADAETAEAATRIAPSEECPTAKRICSPAPRRRKARGVIPSVAVVEEYKRELELKPALCMAEVTEGARLPVIAAGFF